MVSSNVAEKSCVCKIFFLCSLDFQNSNLISRRFKQRVCSLSPWLTTGVMEVYFESSVRGVETFEHYNTPLLRSSSDSNGGFQFSCNSSTAERIKKSGGAGELGIGSVVNCCASSGRLIDWLAGFLYQIFANVPQKILKIKRRIREIESYLKPGHYMWLQTNTVSCLSQF